MKEAIKFILELIWAIVFPVFLFVLPLVGMVIGGALLTLPGTLIGYTVFDDFPPTWYLIIFMVLPAGIGMLAGISSVIEWLSSTASFKKADKNIDKGTWEDYMNR